MNRRTAIQRLATFFLTTASLAEAQQPVKTSQIGYIATPSLSAEAARIEAFRHGLRELSYVEGKNIGVQWQSADGNLNRLPAVAAELVRLKVDIIVTAGGASTRSAKGATSLIPIVMTNDPDPIGDGFVASLARPGGNITGITDVGAEIAGKRLELLKETVPKLSRVAYLRVTSYEVADAELKEVEPVAQFFRIGIQSLEVKGPDDFERAFQAATKKRAEALMVSYGGFLAFHQKRIVELAVKSRLPAMYGNAQSVEAGGLMTYAADRKEQFRRAAEIVDKILKGTKPAEIPVERPKKFDLVINLNAAKRIGLTIPPNVLVRADRVIR